MGEFNQAEYNKAYEKEKYDKLMLRIPKGTREKWKEVAEEQGKSLNAFVVEAVNMRLKDLWIK